MLVNNNNNIGRSSSFQLLYINGDEDHSQFSWFTDIERWRTYKNVLFIPIIFINCKFWSIFVNFLFFILHQRFAKHRWHYKCFFWIIWISIYFEKSDINEKCSESEKWFQFSKKIIWSIWVQIFCKNYLNVFSIKGAHFLERVQNIFLMNAKKTVVFV